METKCLASEDNSSRTWMGPEPFVFNELPNVRGEDGGGLGEGRGGEDVGVDKF
jgi:hypothetical protein